MAQVILAICRGDAVRTPCPKEKFACSAGSFSCCNVGSVPPDAIMFEVSMISVPNPRDFAVCSRSDPESACPKAMK